MRRRSASSSQLNLNALVLLQVRTDSGTCVTVYERKPEVGGAEMYEISRILAPVVFSDNCRGAFRYAVDIASRFNAEITVLHVLEPLSSLDFDTTTNLKTIETSRRDWVHGECSKMTAGARNRVSIKEVCVSGDPATEIVKLADASDTSLIVIATRGRGIARRFLLGSVTAKVLHDARCAVWSGTRLQDALAPGATVGDIRHILCAIDFNPQTDTVLEWASGLACAYGARLSLMHVVAPRNDPAEERVACEDAVGELESRGRSIGSDLQYHVAVGNPAHEVRDTSWRLHADLLVIGRGDIEAGGRLGSTSYAVLREAPCPVLSV
jgi:nucleotide-binding universal stress UspA family protein